MSTTWIDGYLAKFGTDTNDVSSLRFLEAKLEEAVRQTELWYNQCFGLVPDTDMRLITDDLDRYHAALAVVRMKLVARP